MKITHIEMRTVRLPLKEPFTVSKHRFVNCVGHILTLTGEDRTLGYGESVQLESPWYSAETLGTSSLLLRELILPTVLGQETGTTSVSSRWCASVSRTSI